MVDVESPLLSSDFKGIVMRKAKSQKLRFLITAVLLLAISWIGYWIGYGSHSWHDANANSLNPPGKSVIAEGENGNHRVPIRGGGQGSIIEEDHDIDTAVDHAADLKKREHGAQGVANQPHDNIIIVGNDRRINRPNNNNAVDSHRHAQGIHQSHAQHISQHINSKFLKGQEDAGANPNIKDDIPTQNVVGPNAPTATTVKTNLVDRFKDIQQKNSVKDNIALQPSDKVNDGVSFDMNSQYYAVIHSGLPTKIHSKIHDELPHIDEHVDKNSYIFNSEELPKNAKFLPTVGNGHIATKIHGDYIFMNNLYNGYKGESHRAEIPSTVNINITEIEPPCNYTRKYSLNVAQGVFTETLYNDNFTIHHRTYAHRSISHLFVVEIDLTLHVSPSTINNIKLKFPRFSMTTDMTFHQLKTNLSKEVSLKVGRINSPENDTLDYPEAYVYYDHVPWDLKPVEGIKRVKWIYLSSFAKSNQEALSAYMQGRRLAQLNDQLYAQHVTSWIEIWKKGRIDIDGHLPLARAAYASLYYLMSSLPTKHDPNNPFSGLSPTGLAHGALNKDYQGHVFWDQETWMLPPIMMFHPEVAKLMLKSRIRRLAAAKQNAAKNGHTGAQYPWESAYTGIEVCPSTNYSRYEQHISGDISLAIRQYLYATRDKLMVGSEGGGDTLLEIAHFWVGRLTTDFKTGLSGVKDVMGPDEDHFPVSNSAYTNMIAKIALLAPSQAYSLVNISVQSAYKKFADQLYIPFDKEKQYHPEYDGYAIGTEIKQADAILLGYPLLVNMSKTVRQNDLNIYEKVVRPTGPAMSWSMFAIGWLESKNYIKAETYFLKNFQYMQGPFQVWSEETGGLGAVNFLTGMGGFLQALMNGYVGFRLLPDRLNFDPVLPLKSKRVSLIGVNYLGASIDFHINQEYVFMRMSSHDASQPALKLHIYATGITRTLDVDKTVKFKRQKAALIPAVS